MPTVHESGALNEKSLVTSVISLLALYCVTILPSGLYSPHNKKNMFGGKKGGMCL